MKRLPAAVLMFFLSASVLVLEILAARLLAPYVGLSLETYTAIIGVVLAGIAVGHALGGRLADRHPSRTALGTAVVVGGLASAVTVPVVSTFGAAIASPNVAASIVLAVVGFFVPTAAISAASPMITRSQITDVEVSGRVVGSLSAWSTAGALCGTFGTGFVLVAHFPTTRVIYAVAAILTAVGAGLAMTSRLRVAAVAVAVVGGGSVTALAGSPCETETKYYCASIRPAANRSSRILKLDTIFHSYVDLEDPATLGFRYQRVVAASLDARFGPASPIDVVHLGGGGFAFPRYVAATRPGSSNRVFELDPALAGLAAKRLDLDPSLVDVTAGDARTAVTSSPERSADAVVADTFGSLDPPWHLATVEAVQGVRRLLRSDGIYVVDVVDSGPLEFVRAEAATLLAVFPRVVMVRAPSDETPSNVVLVASTTPITIDVTGMMASCSPNPRPGGSPPALLCCATTTRRSKRSLLEPADPPSSLQVGGALTATPRREPRHARRVVLAGY